MGNPQVQELQTAVALKAAGLGIPKVANIGPVENATDNARYRPGARTQSPPWPWPQRVGRGEAGERLARHRTTRRMKSHPSRVAFHRGKAPRQWKNSAIIVAPRKVPALAASDTTTIFQPSLRKAGRS